MPRLQVKGARRRPLSRKTLQFAGLEAAASLPDDPALVAAMRACLSGWPTTVAPGNPALAFGKVTRHRDTYSYDCRLLDRPMTRLSVTGTVCALIADLTLAACDALPGGIGLHCGAVEIGGRLIILTGPHHAGKSTLVARLSAEPGVRLFCDDVLPVTAEGFGLALGIAPRLRLPVPEAADTLRAHADGCLVLSDHRYGYLMPPSLAPHGDLSQLGGLVFLHRGPPGTPARLHRMARADALTHLLERSLSDLRSADEAYALADRLTAGLDVVTLVYSDLDEAATLIGTAFATGTRPNLLPPLPPAPMVGKSVVGKSMPGSADADAALAVAVDARQRLRVQDDLALRLTEGGGFVWRPGDGVLWRLNPVAAAVWTLLADAGRRGTTPQRLAGLLCIAFPDTDPDAILTDTRAILTQFLARDFAISL